MEPELKRSLVNYWNKSTGGKFSASDVEIGEKIVSYVSEKKELPKYKVGILLICLNPPYWQYLKNVVEGIKKFMLPGHDLEIMVWTDMKPGSENYIKQGLSTAISGGKGIIPETLKGEDLVTALNSLDNFLLKDFKGITVYELFPDKWPLPTLLRYNFFLQQEEKLKEFDYLFYVDVDMNFVNYVGDEILGEGLTAAQHPMYALRKSLHPPYEPNEKSSAYIPRPGMIIEEDGKKRLQSLYYAGGFQGGRTNEFIEAMKSMKESIEKDFNSGYTAIWNDESHWNKYLFEKQPPAVVLDPSYVYPDSLIDEYYVPIWGERFNPKIVTLTKPFTTSKEGGEAIRKQMEIPL